MILIVSMNVTVFKTCAKHGGKLLTLTDQASFKFIRGYAILHRLPDILLGLNMTTNIPAK